MQSAWYIVDLRIWIVAFSVAMFAGRGVYAQAPPTATKHTSSTKKKTSKGKSAAAKASAANSNITRPATSPSASTSSTPHRRATSKTGKKIQAKAAPRQQQPTPERYKEIQQALADRGYFNRPPDGQWGSDSIDALKRFQREQNLTDDGKIGSLSLIALGLGPKRPVAEPTPEKVQR
jgi:peptidoglycan hydrolase-like protein with peptidoglycan-binding domain